MSQLLTYFENPRDEPLRDPDRAFGNLDESRYKAELELVDRYQSFVAELLRLSLLGIAVIGFLYKTTSETASDIGVATTPAALGVLLFGISAASALVFRFFAAEGARFYIEALRFAPANVDSTQEQATEAQHAEKRERRAKLSLDTRHKKIVICRRSKAIAAFTLGLGGVLEAVAFCVLLFDLG
jgi:hypothetical protein